MDHKTWLWKKKSSDKTIVAGDKVNVPTVINGEETLGANRVTELERSMENLNGKLSYVLSECKAKDDLETKHLATKHAKAAEEALAGWEKTKAEAASLKQNLDKALQQRVVADERISHLNGALKECMQQLRFVREEQEQRIHDAVMKTTRKHEKTQMVLEEKFAETNKNLSKLGIENTHLSKTIKIKEKLVEDLKRYNSQAEADFNALRARLYSMQKDNASMNYELRMLEKELEIRNEERVFNRRSNDASHKQHLESVRKIAKLETECQRLRLLVRKRLPRPAALARMKDEVDMLKDETGTTRKNTITPMGGSVVKDFSQEISPGSPSKKVNYLIECLCDIEEVNKTLKEAMSKKTNELQSSRIMCARTASKLSQVEAQLAELSKGHTTPRSLPVPRRLSFASESEINASNDAESWPSLLISEMGKARGSPSCKTVRSSDISLMDDFVEMEKLVIVCMEKSPGDSHVSSVGSLALLGPLETESGVSSSEACGKELVPVLDSHSGFGDKDQELRPKDTFAGKYPGWLQDILKMILEQNRVTLRNFDEIIEDIKISLADMSGTRYGEVTDEKEKPSPSKLPHISGYISWSPQSSSAVQDSFDPASIAKVYSNEENTKQIQSGLNESISKIIELIERINQQSAKDFSSEPLLSEDNGTSLPYRNSLTPTGYTYRVFQWKSTELNHVLRQFVHTCNDLLNGHAEFENFARQLTSTFDWIMNHCFSLQDVSSMRDTIKKHFDWDETRSESEHGNGINSSFSETEKPQTNNELSPCLASSATSSAKHFVSQANEMLSNLNEENRRLKDELTVVESAKKDLQVRLQSTTDRIKALMTELQKTEKSTANLQTEVEALKASKGMLEDQIENHKLLNEDLNTQLTVVRAELNEVHQKFSSLEVELEDRKNACHELETTCLEQQLQLESVIKNERKHETEQKERQLQNGWEISAASEKLAECQETILNLGKQLKALASPRETVLLDKVISVTPSTNTAKNNKNHRSSLLDQILAENGIEPDDVESPKMKEIICTMDSQRAPTHLPDNTYDAHSPNGQTKSLKHFNGSNETRYRSDTTAGGALAIIPSKQRGGGISLLRKLLSRRKRDTSRRMSLPTK